MGDNLVYNIAGVWISYRIFLCHILRDTQPIFSVLRFTVGVDRSAGQGHKTAVYMHSEYAHWEIHVLSNFLLDFLLDSDI